MSEHEKHNSSNELTESEQQIETPVDTPVDQLDETTPETPADQGSEEVFEALDGIDLGEEEAAENLGNAESKPLSVSAAERKMAAQMTAAAATGAAARGVEWLFRAQEVEVTDDHRQEFFEALTPVMEKHDGAMPPWLAKLLDEWKEELMLAKKTAAIGFAIWDEAQERKAKKDLPRKRVPAQMGEAA